MQDFTITRVTHFCRHAKEYVCVLYYIPQTTPIETNETLEYFRKKPSPIYYVHILSTGNP